MKKEQTNFAVVTYDKNNKFMRVHDSLYKAGNVFNGTGKLCGFTWKYFTNLTREERREIYKPTKDKIPILIDDIKDIVVSYVIG